jgi:hypothetical protein
MSERGNLGNLGFPDCQVSLRNFSGVEEYSGRFFTCRDFFRAFLDPAKNARPLLVKAKICEASSSVLRLIS